MSSDPKVVEEQIIELPVKIPLLLRVRRRWEDFRHGVQHLLGTPSRLYVRWRDRGKVTRQEIEKLYKVNHDALEQCPYCGGWHQHACPKVKRITYAEGSQNAKDVEFFDHGRWPRDQVIWPWDLAARIKESPEEEKK